MTSNADAFNDASATFQPETRTAPARAYHRKWQGAFDAAEDEENAKIGGVRASMSDRMKRNWKLQSIPGFIFGPLYYFYLGMWRKGLLIIALVPILALAEAIVGSLKAASFLIPALCMTLAKRDYYKFCVKGEMVWPIFRFSKSIWTDAAMAAAAFIVCVAGTIALDHGDSTEASPSAASGGASTTTQQAAAQASPEEITAPPGTVTITKRPDLKISADYYDILIMSRADNLRILNVVANRGTCNLIVQSTNYLRFGQTFQEYAMCNPIEVTVTTSLGTATATWDR